MCLVRGVYLIFSGGASVGSEDNSQGSWQLLVKSAWAQL